MRKLIKSSLLLFVLTIGSYDTKLCDAFNLIGDALGNPPDLFSATPNGIVSGLGKLGDFARDFDRTLRDVSAAGKGLAKTAKEVETGLDETKKDWKKKKNKKRSSNPDERKLETEKKKLDIERQARELEFDRNIASIKQKSDNLQKEKERKMNSFDQQILKSRDDLQRQQLLLQKSQTEFDYDKKLEEYADMLEKSEKSKESALLDIKTRVSIVDNQISEITKQEEKHREAKETMERIKEKTGVNLISREELARKAEEIRQKHKNAQQDLQKQPESSKRRVDNKLTMAEQADIIRNKFGS